MVAVAALLPRWVAGVSWTVLVASVVVGPMFRDRDPALPRWMQDMSPFTLIPKAPAPEITATPVVSLLAIAAVLAGAGLVAFRRRKLALPVSSGRSTMNGHSASRPRVVIVGGGMGGIAASKALAKAPVEVTLVDGHNYYLFQPLLYEVAGAIVNIEDVTHAIRGLLRGQPNIHFRLATVVAVDLQRQQVTLQDGDRLRYEYLILATGLRSDVARVPGAAEHAFPMKTLEDALGLRNHLLRRLESVAAHPELVAAGALDIVIVGGSTTGVEVVAAFSELYNHALRQEFPEIDFTQTKITLIEAGDALLPMFHPRLRRWVERVLARNGAQIRLRSPVAEIGPASVTLESGEEIPAGTIIVATGVGATALTDRLGVAQAAGGRVLVDPNLSIPGHPDAFAIGDMAALPSGEGAFHPALAQFALQGGRHAAHEIVRQIEDKPSRRFRYWDKGMTSMVGYNAAILQSGRLRLKGGLGFFLWGTLHGYYVPGLRNRLSLRLTWLWSWATRRRAALLLIEGPPTPPRHADTANLPLSQTRAAEGCGQEGADPEDALTHA